MQIKEVRLSKQQLDSIPEDDRFFLVQIGHLANELAALNRLLLFVSNTTCNSELETRARNSQAFLLIRLCSGKLFEGWKMLQRDYFGSKLSRKYDNSLDQIGKTSLNDIKQYFGKSNLITTIRNEYAFHYSSDKLRKRLPTLKHTDELYIYLGPSYGNSFYYLSDLMVGLAMLTNVPCATPQQAMDALFAEPIKVIKWFLDLSYSYVVVTINKYIGTVNENVIEVNGSHLEHIVIPFFIEPESDNNHF